MDDIYAAPVVPERLTDPVYVLETLRGISRRNGQTSRRTLRAWHDLLFAVWCWVRDENYAALSIYLGQHGLAGELAWASLCDVVDRPLVTRQGHTLEARVLAFPVMTWVRRGDVVGRFRLSHKRLPGVHAALADLFDCARVGFLPELLSLQTVREISYLDHLTLNERIVAGKGAPGVIRRTPTRVSPGVWHGLFIVWQDSRTWQPERAFPSDKLVTLREALSDALPEGIVAQMSVDPAMTFLNAAQGHGRGRRLVSAVSPGPQVITRPSSLTAPVKNEIAC